MHRMVAPSITVLALAAPAADVHVDAQADCAAGNGTQAAPFCTLGEGLAAAVAGETVRIAPGRYLERVTVTRDVVLVGDQGAGVTTIDGSGVGPLIEIEPGLSVEIEGLTLTASGGDEGAVFSQGDLALRRCVLRGNRATVAPAPRFQASAILHRSLGVLDLEECLIEDNTSPVGGGHPVVSASPEPVSIRRCTFEDNTGLSFGALDVRGPVAIVDSTFTGNTDNDPNSSSIFYLGLVNASAGVIEVRGSTFHDNDGAALRVSSGSQPFAVRSCTFTENRQTGSSFASTIQAPFVTVNVTNSILSFGGPGVGLEGNYVSGGHNDFSQTGPGGIATFQLQPTDVVGGGPLGLLPLADNGGPTPTRLPGCGSRLIGAGPPVLPEPFDQRGVSRIPGFNDRGACQADCRGVAICTSTSNSAGLVGRMSYRGGTGLSASDLTLEVTGAPAGRFGFFLTSLAPGFTAMPGGSQGNLCLDGVIGRFVRPGEVVMTTGSGRASLPIDANDLPQGGGPQAAQPGETWLFQFWHRDVVVPGVPTSNFSDAIGVTLR